MRTVKPKFQRIRVLRPETPPYLRPELWLLVGALGYFSYTKANFYAPLYYQQWFPQGPVRALSNELDRFFNEHGFWQESWAIPVRQYQTGNGQCFILKPGPADAPLAVTLGEPVAFVAPLPSRHFEPGFRCTHQNIDVFNLSLAPGAAGELRRSPAGAVGIVLEQGSAKLELLPQRAAEILLPNGVLTLSSTPGAHATIERRGGLLAITIVRGEAHLTAELAGEYRASALAVELASGEEGKLFAPERRAALKPGKPVRLAPSGVYDQENR